jgi:YVTN family beta-propeller protein
MGYIIKNTSGLVNTRLTDTGRLKLSQGNFNISYFQIGDSEVSYNTLPSTYNQFETFVLEPSFNAQNSAGAPQSNKENVKYPYYVDGFTGNTYGIPFMDSIISPVYNRAVMRGFFTGNTSEEPINWSALTNNQYAVNSNYVIQMNQLTGSNKIELQYDECNGNSVRGPMVGDIITIFYDGRGLEDCNCSNVPIPSPTPTPTPSSTPAPCWENGFVANVYQEVQINPGDYLKIPFEKTGTIINGKPYYSSYSFGFTIYWDGVQWVIYSLFANTTFPLGSTPLGEFAFDFGENLTTGFTECGSSCIICVNKCADKFCEQNLYFESFLSGNTVYSPYDESELVIIYSSETQSWVLFEPSTEMINGELTGLTSNDCPIGQFIPTFPLTSLETSEGYCPSQTCDCIRFTSQDSGATINYFDCDGVVQNIQLGAVPVTACVFDNQYLIVSGSSSVDYCCATTVFSTNKSTCVLTYKNCDGQIIDLTIPGFNSYTDCIDTSFTPIFDTECLSATISDSCLQCGTQPTTYKSQVTIEVKSNTDPCASPTPTPTPSATFCPTPTPSKACPPPPPPDCVVDTRSCYPILTYRITDVCFNTITLDRPTPDFSFLLGPCYARTIIYPPSMVSFYDSYTPRPHWNDNVINFESVCYTDEFDVKIWNMNIPWSENPAGLNSAISKDYTQFGSIQYLGTKEYLGYASSSGQTDTDSVYYFNSFGDKIIVTPEEQKAIAIIHYTNQTVDFFYGEKFALEPFENVDDTTGQARNFKLHIPWLMWHKNPDCCHGQTFWVDPPGFDELELFKVHYIQSKKNVDMNNPGIRYYHLWDNNPNVNGYPNRVGKVFPDAKIIIVDDEELIAAMSYKSNRNWTLPAPRLSLITPNTCGTDINSAVGILTGESETLYVTYRLTNTNVFTNSLHNNYYSVIQGPNLCLPFSSQNVAVRFGGEFNCLNQPSPYVPTTTTTTFNPYTTTTTFNPSTTTTTTSEQICGKCYQIIRDGDDGTLSYTNCDGSTVVINVGIQSGTPKFVCSPIEPIPPIKISVIPLGDCTPLTDCTPCWMTGFTFSFLFPGAYGDPNATFNFVFYNSGSYESGYPVFTNSAFLANIFYNGVEWVFNNLVNFPTNSVMFTGITPLNQFDFLFEGSQFSGETSCKEPDNFCMTVTKDDGGILTVSTFDFFSITTTGGTYYAELFDLGYDVRFSGGTWILYDPLTDTTISTLPGVLSTEVPIGTWSTDPGTTIVTTLGDCPSTCNCYNFSGDSPLNTVNYVNCDGVNSELIFPNPSSGDICIKDELFVLVTSGITTGTCDSLICNPITLSNPLEPCYNITQLESLETGAQPQSGIYVPWNRYLYTINIGSQNVTVIDTMTNTFVTTIPLPNIPFVSQSYKTIVYNPDNFCVYISDVSSNTIQVIDTTTDTITASITVSTQQNQLFYKDNQNKLYVKPTLTTDLDIIDTTTNTVIITTSVVLSEHITYNPINECLYFKSYGPTPIVIQVFDTITDSVISSTPTAIINTGEIFYCSINDKLYASDTPNLLKYNPYTLALESTIFVGNNPSFIKETPNYLYVLNQSMDTVTTVDLTTDSTTTISVSPGAQNTVYNSTNGYMYVISSTPFSTSINMIDVLTNTIVQTLFLEMPIPNSVSNFGIFIPNSGNVFVNAFDKLSVNGFMIELGCPTIPIVTTTTTIPFPIVTTTTTFCPPYCDTVSGFYADKFEIIAQKVPTGERPSSSEWKILDFTDQLSATTINGFITQEGLTGNTFVITQEDYDNAPYYNLNDYIDLTPQGFTGSQLNFGDEYYFYGSLETDIQATIYEMRYKINLGQSEFLSPSNPSWTNGNQSYVTEIGLYDSDKNLMIISKMQSPVLRQGIQQFLIKFDL